MQGATLDRSRRRLRRNPVLAGAIFVLLVLLMCWPFVRQPALDLARTYYHLFGLWSGLVLLLWWLSRGLPERQASDAGPEGR